MNFVLIDRVLLCSFHVWIIDHFEHNQSWNNRLGSITQSVVTPFQRRSKCVIEMTIISAKKGKKKIAENGRRRERDRRFLSRVKFTLRLKSCSNGDQWSQFICSPGIIYCLRYVIARKIFIRRVEGPFWFARLPFESVYFQFFPVSFSRRYSNEYAYKLQI